MSLPVLQSHPATSPADLVRLFHRTQLHFSQHLGETTTLDVGSAIVNASLGRLRDANQIRDACLPAGMNPEQTCAQVKAHFDSLGATCLQWTLNPSIDPAQSQTLRNHLAQSGYIREKRDIYYLSALGRRDLPDIAGVRIIPSRASFRHVRQIGLEMSARWNEPALADGFERHLDDPHWDSLLALFEGRAVAHVGVLAVGDVGRIAALFVSSDFRQSELGRMMMNRGIEICARSLFKHVFFRVNPENKMAIRLLGEYGFERIGEVESFVIPVSSKV